MLHDKLFFDTAIITDEEIPDWKRLDIAMRKMAILSGMEKDLSDYQKRKENFQ